MTFDQVVFAGGGNRCWWQAGFWHALEERFPQNPQLITAVSAGAATACLMFTRPGILGAQWTLNYYERLLKDISKNAYWENLFTSKRIFPHYELYKNVLTHVIGERFDLLKAAPPIRIGLARAPQILGAYGAVLVGLVAYNLEKRLKKSLHPEFGEALGFSREFISTHECENAEQLVELILQSSCTPPFTPIMKRDGNVVLDGGLVDNVPIDGLNPSSCQAKVLVLLTRCYDYPPVFKRKVGFLELTYVQPSHQVPISSWDYSRQYLMPITYEQGLKDAQNYITSGILQENT